MTNLDWSSTLVKCKIVKGKVHPVGRAELQKYEREQKIQFPKSYYGFCKVFGPGCIITGHEYDICVPYAKISKYDIGHTNDGMHRSIKIAGQDGHQLQRAIYFASDMNSSHYFWDPSDVTNEQDHEYGVYIVYSNNKIERICDTFWDFVHTFCLRTEDIEEEWGPCFRPGN